MIHTAQTVAPGRQTTSALRRSLARGLDIVVLAPIWGSVAALIHHSDIRSPNGPTFWACLAIAVTYETTMVRLFGATVGKMAFGIRVLPRRNSMSWGKALGRTVLCTTAILAYPFLPLAWLSYAGGERRLMFYDVLSGTSVDPPAPRITRLSPRALAVLDRIARIAALALVAFVGHFLLAMAPVELLRLSPEMRQPALVVSGLHVSVVLGLLDPRNGPWGIVIGIMGLYGSLAIRCFDPLFVAVGMLCISGSMLASALRRRSLPTR